MIANDRQYKITKSQLERFEGALSRLLTQPQRDDVHPVLVQAEVAAVQSQLDDLRDQLEEYESLQSGRRSVLEINSFEELPRALIQARIAAGWSQRDLAERLHLKEQQIQRYEATLYASASFERLREVTQALGIRVRNELFLANAAVGPEQLWNRLSDLGLEREFVLQRLVPRAVAAHWLADPAQNDDRLVLETASAVARIYGVSPSALFDPASLAWSAASGAARFKVAANANGRRLGAYVIYAHYLALLVAASYAHAGERRTIPTDPVEVHRAIVETFGIVTFETALRYAWSLGVAVLPLNDPSAFHGACWRSRGQNVIVLKQRTRASARWLFDLLHELRHAAEVPQDEEFSLVELPETAAERRESEGEVEASLYAGNVALGGQAEALTAQVQREAGNNLRNFKAAAERVAARANVAVGALANYLAFRLSLEGEDWWGAAANLQPQGDDPWRVARDVFLEHVDFSGLSEFDRNLLAQALKG